MEGAHFKNAFVTTALCSPSRASVLTGRYAHKHRIVDNNTAIPAGTVFFPSYLQKAGYKTGFFGKWHMGAEGDDPKPGFDQWVSFRGQGKYMPGAKGLNVNGKKVPQKGYITNELTDYALDWLKNCRRASPYFLYFRIKGCMAISRRRRGKRPIQVMPSSYRRRQWRRKAKWPRTGRCGWKPAQFLAWHGLSLSLEAWAGGSITANTRRL